MRFEFLKYFFFFFFLSSQAPKALDSGFYWPVVDLVCYELLNTRNKHWLFSTGHSFIVIIFYCCYRNIKVPFFNVKMRMKSLLAIMT